ncbi:MAG: GNAT family N-acetyltransferase [bacterium]|nr:GNAT family N-acetyltransferase [bacterium]
MTTVSADQADPVQVEIGNVDETSFFCLQSRVTSPGYLRKRAWLEERFAEGLKIHMLGRRERTRWIGDRGLVEYVPGKYAWRGIEAEDYLVIHCLWVVGQSRGKGGAQKLLDICFAEAKAGGFAGVVAVAAENGFMTSRRFYEHAGFSSVAETEPRMSVMVYRLDDDAPPPSLAKGAGRGPAAYPTGLTIFRADQCPYVEDATATILAQAEAHGIAPVNVVTLDSAESVREKSPTPYGVFGSVLDGQLLSYRYLTPKEFDTAVARVRG